MMITLLPLFQVDMLNTSSSFGFWLVMSRLHGSERSPEEHQELCKEHVEVRLLLRLHLHHELQAVHERL